MYTFTVQKNRLRIVSYYNNFMFSKTYLRLDSRTLCFLHISNKYVSNIHNKKNILTPWVQQKCRNYSQHSDKIVISEFKTLFRHQLKKFHLSLVCDYLKSSRWHLLNL